MKAKAVIAVLALIGGCVSPPIGPTVAVLPAPGKPLDKFAEEDAYCREYARHKSLSLPSRSTAS